MLFELVDMTSTSWCEDSIEEWTEEVGEIVDKRLAQLFYLYYDEEIDRVAGDRCWTVSSLKQSRMLETSWRIC